MRLEATSKARIFVLLLAVAAVAMAVMSLGHRTATYAGAPLRLRINASCEPGTAGKPIDCHADATGGFPPYGFSWDVGKDGTLDGFGPDFTVTFPTKGTYSIDACVLDSSLAGDRSGAAGGTRVCTNLPVPVAPQPFAVTASCEGEGTAGKPIACSASASGGTTPYLFRWDVGKDGTIDADGPTFNPVFPVKGIYHVVAIVIDANSPVTGLVVRINFSIVVRAQPLVLTASCSNGKSGRPIQCDASATGGTEPYQFRWDVGKDGVIDGDGEKFHPVFPHAGDFSVEALVIDANDELAFINIPVTILAQLTKDPRLANLWLCNSGAAACSNPEHGIQEVTFEEKLGDAVGDPDPKCTGFPDFLSEAECRRLGRVQSIGSFEFEVRYDSKLLQVDVEQGSIWPTGIGTDGHSITTCSTNRTESSIQFACNVKGKDNIITGPGTLAVVHVRATADVYSMLIPNQLNGIVTQVINQDCNLSDLQGHPIVLHGDPSDICTDGAVTLRYLEGDVHADCIIDLHDQQQIAFRWNARSGSLLYNSRFDLEPSLPKKGDGDIDGKDLQSVWGRHGSVCSQSGLPVDGTHPPQPAIDPKAKVEPAPTP